ncbi:MAG: elongation factor P [Alphaproteobacteria bacterium]
MKINANSIRQGNVLEHNGRLWRVSKTPSWAMPGKGGAFVQVEMKDIKSGTKLNERFRSSEDIEKVRLDQKEYQFLYFEGDNMVLMDTSSYEQIQVDKEILGDQVGFLSDNMIITVESYEESPISIILPDTVILEIEQADAVIKGQTASSSYKPAVLSNGMKIMVPPFIEAGTKIVVKTEDCSYVERAK